MRMPDTLPSSYAHAVRDALGAELGEELVGVYLYGSAANGAYQYGQSDVDMIVVVREHLGAERVQRLLGGVRATPLPADVKGLDLWVVPLRSAREPCGEPAFECWLLTLIDRELIGGSDHPGDARLVLLYAMCRDHGVALAGPPPRRVFGRIARSWLVDAMRVDLALAGAAGWYRVLNACRTLHFVEEGRMCGKLTGAAWARMRVADSALIDAAVEWRRNGSGPPLPPGHVDAFVSAVAARLDGAPAGDDAEQAAIPAVDPEPVALDDGGPLVTCVLVAPPSEELLLLAVRRFAEQDWPARELLVLRPPGATPESALPQDDRIRAIPVAAEDAGVWGEFALASAHGDLLAAWDAATWYSPDRLTQQVRELLSTSTPRLVTPSLVAYDPARKVARRLRGLELLERATLCARRPSWNAVGSATRLGERPDIAILVENDVAERGEPASAPLARVVVGEELDVYAAAVSASPVLTSEPAVSCLMPTYNRRQFAERAIGFFLEQDYANRELVIVDDGEDPIADLVPPGVAIRYHRLAARATIGTKRELACRLADGELLIQWDDDDWYGPSRLRRQVAPLVAGCADITGILHGCLLDLNTFRFWKGQPPLHEGDLHALIVAGTLAYTQPAWREAGGYPDRSIGEEVALLQGIIDGGGRVAPILSDGIYICVRHAANSWRLRFDADQGPPGWAAIPPPDFLSAGDMTFYRSLSEAAAAA
jgi:hypothetical protein